MAIRLAAAASFGYNGGELVFARDDTLAFISGVALKFLNIETGEETFAWGSGAGLNVFAVNAKTGLLAYASDQIDTSSAAKAPSDAVPAPAVFVLTYPQLDVLVALQGAYGRGVVFRVVQRKGVGEKEKRKGKNYVVFLARCRTRAVSACEGGQTGGGCTWRARTTLPASLG